MEMSPTYNYFLVALSYFVAVFGSFVSLQLVKGMRESSHNHRFKWIAAAACALGGGAIWAMHFIGMLAYEASMDIAYAPGLTFMSLALAVIVVGAGLSFLSMHRQSFLHLLGAGIITGLGVASMHYTGMEAMVMAADMSYDTTLVSVSIGIAIVAATAALWLAFNLDGTLQMVAASFIMGLAVCGMHYTGMAAMTMTPSNSHVHVASSVAPLTLGLLIFCFSMLLLVTCLIVTLVQLNRRMYAELEAELDDDLADEAPAAKEMTPA